VPLPDPGTLPTERPKPKSVPSKVGRKLKEAAPRCLDFVLHTCWAQPTAEEKPYAATPAAAKDLEVGDFNFKEKNYLGAKLRYRHALESDPNTPEAMFKLARTLEREGKNDEARCTYTAFLGMGTDLPFASEATAAVQRVKPSGGQEQPCPSSEDR
jgi:tetratricopeptide (TPR) repeat protein